MAAKPASRAGGVLTRKVGPVPLWGWLVAAAVAFFLLKRFGSGGASAAQISPSSVDTGTNASGLGNTSAPASGQGSAADNLNAGLAAALAGNLTDVNSNLVTALLGSQSAIEGMGTQALGLAGDAVQSSSQMAQSIVSSYVPQSFATNTPAVQVPAIATPSAPLAVAVTAPAQQAAVIRPYNAPAAVIASQPPPSWDIADPVAFRDETGHVVNAKGARVGGRADISG